MPPPLPIPPRLVVFDCDGVLIDSEGASARLLAIVGAEHGVHLTPAQLHAFMGRRWSDLQPDMEGLCGAKRFGPLWPAEMQARLLAQMAQDGLPLIPGARAALLGVRDLGLPYRIASNSSLSEMAEKFRLSGLTDLTEGLYHSSGTSGRGKPAPDVYLEACAAAAIPPAQAIAIEDSAPGVRAAIAAGLHTLALCLDEESRRVLQGLGAVPVASMNAALAVITAAASGAQ